MAGPNGPQGPNPEPQPYKQGNKWIVPTDRLVLDIMDLHGVNTSKEADLWSDLLYRDPTEDSNVAPSTRRGKENVTEDFYDLLTEEQSRYGFSGDRGTLEELRAQRQGATGRLGNAIAHFGPGTLIKASQGLAYTGSY